MSCISPKITSDDKSATDISRNNGAPLQAARRGLLKAVWQASFAPHFSSRPIDMDDYFSRESFAQNSTLFSSFAVDSTDENDQEGDVQHSIIETKNLTEREQSFLENLLQSEDLNSIRRASERLADKEIFPPPAEPRSIEINEKSGTISSRNLKRRESEVQRELYRLHQNTTVKPSALLRRMSTHEKQTTTTTSRAKLATASTPLIPPLQQSNSIITTHSHGEAPKSPTTFSKAPLSKKQDDSHNNGNDDDDGSWDMDSADGNDNRGKPLPPLPPLPPSSTSGRTSRPQKLDSKNWNPFGDVDSWIDGNEGVEVSGEGIPLGAKNLPSPTSNPFKILGTSADDISAHPHVLTPPLMEGLQEFMPESLHEHHFWLKYSLVRDGSRTMGGQPPLLDLLRECRASEHTILAMETTSGYVFGAFCSQPWRLQGDQYWGTRDSFVWKMRRSRTEPCESIVEQVLRESKIDVFPFTGQNSKVQQCSLEKGITLGEGELPETSTEGEHFGHAIQLGPSMMEAWTSTCETFGNPCLIPSDRRGEHVEISNVELWALTPHRNIESAVTAEMQQLFLAENPSPNEKNLNLFEILVGGPV